MFARRFCIAAAVSLIGTWSSAQTVSTANNAQPADVPLKPSRTPLEAAELRAFTSLNLAFPETYGAQGAGRELRTLHGQLVDHLGRPIAGALVGLQEEIGLQNPTSLENCDKTDELGRFLVRGDLLKDRVEVRRSSESIWNQVAEPDQTYMKIVWPKPSQLRLEIDTKMLLAGKEFTVSSSDYWTDSTYLSIIRAQTHEGVTTLTLLPGSYRVMCPKRFTVDGAQVERLTEAAAFSVRAGEDQTVRVRQRSGIVVTNVGANPTNGVADAAQGDAQLALLRGSAYISRVKTRYSEMDGLVDIAELNASGQFRARVSGPGVYTLAIVRPAAAPANGAVTQINFSDLFARPRDAWFVVKEGAQEVKVSSLASAPRSAVAARVEKVLNVAGLAPGYANIDNIVTQLSADANRDEVANELLRIVNDEGTPYAWIYPACKALGEMTGEAGVVEGVMAAWDVPFREFDRHDVTSALENPQRMQPQAIDWLDKRTGERKLRLRMSAYLCLLQFAVKQPAYRARIAPILTRGLSDPYHQIRSRMAGGLAWIEATEAAEPLRSRLSDPDQAVRLEVARAIWRLTGDSGPLVQIGTELLAHENWDLRCTAAYQLQPLDRLPEETLAALRANLDLKPVTTTRGRGLAPVVPLHTRVIEAARRALEKHQPKGDGEPGR